ncbi:hypothetical protein GUITHDRAFT_141055 [Guillardia theta CCMP2712]|uniref:Uncharacterized protein n=1 Tax=Guillardia theta (strain CCMP2712) TaxID=905079 RepID=L1J3C2_GUITC|nr:hypothetical protein GUITHDRAFT_141055 [Guillardia theta CCMP2712]EKX42639.1 hypothetical protein GUITHDRAFT_141055 [Guillardia theta CCMP2712]|eukprot:XP_005829619.1 hypothetical protein GUITHDRAFT_141055 [Guillardia theta CCMP2712]
MQWSRRALLLTGGVALPAFAFENRIVDLRPELDGVPYGARTAVPEGVGEGTALKGCPPPFKAARPAPNCFSSFIDPKKDRDHYYKPFKYNKDEKEAMNELLAAVKAYPPGQANIDAGGWKLVRNDDRYIYVQYESGKIGYLDDLEFLMDPETKSVNVRSASRAGFLDFGVNAKRINWYAKYLRNLGWETTDVTPDNYRFYFKQNGTE